MMITIKLYTDKELKELRDMRKEVTNPGALWLNKPTLKPVHRQRSFKASSKQDENSVAGKGEPVHRFEVYQRQNIQDDKDFSCGIAYLPHGGSRLTLARYNGPSHQHEDIDYRTHIHHATAGAIAAGQRHPNASRKRQIATRHSQGHWTA